MNKSNSKGGSPEKEAVFCDSDQLDSPIKEPGEEIRISEIHTTKMSQQVCIDHV